jgi:hypothetical protein
MGKVMERQLDVIGKVGRCNTSLLHSDGRHLWCSRMQLRFSCAFHVEVNRGAFSNNPSPTVAVHTRHLYNKLQSSLRAHTNQVDFMYPVRNSVIIIIIN